MTFFAQYAGVEYLHLMLQTNRCTQINYAVSYINIRRSQWPRDLRRRSAAVRLLRLCARIPLEAWMCVCCVVLSEVSATS